MSRNLTKHLQILTLSVIIIKLNAMMKESKCCLPFRECPPWLKAVISAEFHRSSLLSSNLELTVGVDGKSRYRLQECLLLAKITGGTAD